LAEGALRGIGYHNDEARIIADHVIDAAICGYEYSGLPKILNVFESEHFRLPRRSMKVLRETEVSLAFDGGRWQRRQPEPFPSCSLPMAIPSEWPGSKSQPAGRQCHRYHHIRRSRGHPAPAAAARTRAEPTTSAWDQCSLREKTLDVGGPPHMRLCLLINSARHHVNDRQ
jgi:hypothetical protein